MTNYLLPAAAGLICGVLSGFGIGGGTLLIIYLVNISGIPQQAAQGINLLYFLPTSAASLISHFKNGLVDKQVLLPTMITGIVFSLLAALTATFIHTEILRRFFGIFLIAVGIKELFSHNTN